MKHHAGLSFLSKLIMFMLCTISAIGIGMAFFCTEPLKPRENFVLVKVLSPGDTTVDAEKTFNVNDTIKVLARPLFAEQLDTLAFGALQDAKDSMSEKALRELGDSTMLTGSSIKDKNTFSISFSNPGKFILAAVGHLKDGTICCGFDSVTIGEKLTGKSDVVIATDTTDTNCAVAFGDDSVSSVSITSTELIVVLQASQPARNDIGIVITISAKNKFTPVHRSTVVKRGESSAELRLQLNDTDFVAHPDTLAVIIDSVSGGYVGSRMKHTIIFTDSTPLFTITYDGNGNIAGNVPEDTTHYTTGAKATVLTPMITFGKKDFFFDGWNSARDGSGSRYNTGTTFIIGGRNVTLYAQWSQEERFSVTYNGNGATGGEVPVDGMRFVAGNVATVRKNTGALSKTGHSFIGWQSNGKEYDSGDTIKIGNASVVLYARWLVNSYEITFDANSAEGGTVPAKIKRNYDDTATIPGNTENLERTGFSFAGWNRAVTDSGTTYPADTVIRMGAENMTMYAVWKVNQYDVVYDANDGSGAVPAKTAYDYGAVAKVAIPGDCVRTGFAFAGWNTKADGSGKAYAPGDTFTMGSAATTLYAQWMENRYTVSYNGNGSIGGNVQATVAYKFSASVKVAGNSGNLVRTGYTFAGWNSAKDGKGSSYPVDSTFTVPAENVVLYAQWTVNKYTLRYNANGGGGEVPKDTAYDYGSSITISRNTGNCALTGNTFSGWNTKADGSGVTYPVDTVITMGAADLELFAKWTAQQFTIVYFVNESTMGMLSDTLTYYYNATARIEGMSSFARTGYSFTEWNTVADGSGVRYPVDTQFAMPANPITLYAQWKINTCTVNYLGNGFTGGTVPLSMKNEYNASVTIARPGSMVRTGHTFYSWNTAKDGSGNDYAENTSMVLKGDVVLYARWTANPYSLAFAKNGADADVGGSTAAQTIVFGQSATLTKNGFTRTGYSFAGWAKPHEGGQIEFVDGATYTMLTEGAVLIAMWTANPYNVTFDPNGGTGTMAPQTIVFGNTVALVAKGFTRTGYNFAGWATSPEGEVVYGDKVSFTMMTEGVVLYAKWNPAGMIRVPAKNATFTMGEMITQQVKLTADFWLDSTEVTQERYKTVMMNTYTGFTPPSWNANFGIGNNYPAYFVNWYDAVLFCNALTKMIRSSDTVYSYTSITGIPGNKCTLIGLQADLTKSGYRLPTEAQWEFACRGGTVTSFFWGKNYDPYPQTVEDSNQVDSYAVWQRNSENKGLGNPGFGTHEVATRNKNGYGLYDMCGNVNEWCHDWSWSYGSDLKVDPAGASDGSARKYRGGGWHCMVAYLRSFSRGEDYDGFPDRAERDLGIRTCLPAR